MDFLCLLIVNNMKGFFLEHYTQKMVSSVFFVELEPRWFVSTFKLHSHKDCSILLSTSLI